MINASEIIKFINMINTDLINFQNTQSFKEAIKNKPKYHIIKYSIEFIGFVIPRDGEK